jgi:hypothetical protein
MMVLLREFSKYRFAILVEGFHEREKKKKPGKNWLAFDNLEKTGLNFGDI